MGTKSFVTSKRLNNRQNDNTDQKQNRHFIHPAIKNMAAPVAVMFEIEQPHAAKIVVNQRQRQQRQFCVQPTGIGINSPVVSNQHPNAEYQGRYHARRHNAEEQLAFHDLKPFIADLVIAHCVINIQARQVKQAGKPSDHKNQV